MARLDPRRHVRVHVLVLVVEAGGQPARPASAAAAKARGDRTELPLLKSDAPPSPRGADSVDVCVVVKTGPIGSLYPDSRSTAQRGGAVGRAAAGVGVAARRRGRRGRRGRRTRNLEEEAARPRDAGGAARRPRRQKEDGVAARRERARKLADARVHPRLVGEAAQVADDVVHRHRAVDVEDDGRRVRVPQVDERLRRDALAQIVHHLVPPGDERAGRVERRELEARRRGEFLRLAVLPEAASGLDVWRARAPQCRRAHQRVNTAGCTAHDHAHAAKSTATPLRGRDTLLPLRSRSNTTCQSVERRGISCCTHNVERARVRREAARRASAWSELLSRR